MQIFFKINLKFPIFLFALSFPVLPPEVWLLVTFLILRFCHYLTLPEETKECRLTPSYSLYQKHRQYSEPEAPEYTHPDNHYQKVIFKYILLSKTALFNKASFEKVRKTFV